MIYNFSFLLIFFVLIFLLFHDWIDIYPLNDLSYFNKKVSLKNKIIMTVINSLFAFIHFFILCYYYSDQSISLPAFKYIIFYNILFIIGIIFSWWIPYFFGWPKQQIKELEIFK